MQNKYVLNDKYKIEISEVKNTLSEIINNKNIVQTINQEIRKNRKNMLKNGMNMRIDNKLKRSRIW